MKTLAEIKIGETFKVADIEFIKFADRDGNTVAVAKDSVFNSIFGKDNNYAKSNIKSCLENEFLSKIEQEVGAENIVEHEVDLLSLDGDDKWGKTTCRISIPTFDFYRQHVKIFDKHKLDEWWWLATPYSTPKHDDDEWVKCVSPSGIVNYDYCNNYYGVRPFCILKSDIFVSR